MDSLPFGKRLPGAVYLLDPGDDPDIPSLLRITVAELRKRYEIGPGFNLLKFHTASPKISFLSAPSCGNSASARTPSVTGRARRNGGAGWAGI